MTTTPEEIDLWRSSPSETQRLEFKEAKNQFDFKRLLSYCVAIANEGGGHLLFGIRDKPPRVVVGSAAAQDPIGFAADIFEHLGFRVDVEPVEHPDGRVVVFHIPPRPRGTAYHLKGTYLMRAGEETVAMSEDQLRKIFNEGQPSWEEEAAMSGLSPSDVVELLDTQAYFELLKLPYPSKREGVLDRLLGDRLVDRHDGAYSIRRLGALLLAKRLEAFPDVARKAPRVVVYKGGSKLETRLDQVGLRGYAVGFQSLVGFVMTQLPQNEVIKDALRTEAQMVPEIAVREVIANALVHQDLLVSGASVMVEVYADRIEISNPGEPIVPVERFIDGYQSRNERLADIMRRLGICEEKSSGVDKVVSAAELHQLPAPDFRVGPRRITVVLGGPKSFGAMTREERVRACFQHCALRWVTGKAMTNQSLRERFRLSESKSAIASQVIAATIEAGLIKLDESVGGSRKYARYLPSWA